VIDTDFAHLKRRATANPNGPEALRLDWLLARAVGSPRRHLLDLIGRYRDRDFSIAEIDAYIDEQLANAREGLEQAQRTGSIAPRTLRALEQTIETAVAAERRRHTGAKNPILVQALEMAGEFLEKRGN
jgi:DNA-binding transcriptional MerR regulator